MSITLNELQWPIKGIDPYNGFKDDPHISCLQDIYFRSKDTKKLKVNGRKYIFNVNNNQKSAGMLLLMSNKIEPK